MLWTAEENRFRWLEPCREAWQFGEQGVLDALALRLPGLPCIGCEIGAGNGDNLPVTLERFYRRGWELHLWEADPQSRQMLGEMFPKARINGIYEPGAAGTDVISRCGICVIDVDGNDWKFASHLPVVPPVLLIEHQNINADWPPSLANLQPHQQASWQHLEGMLCRTHTLVGRSLVNSLFVAHEKIPSLI